MSHFQHKIQSAYTLVELIVVIAILVVLSTVGFVGYSQYTASSRDGARISDLRAIYQAVGVSMSQKGIAPAPDSPVSIFSGTGVLLSLQGSVGESVRQTIGLESGGRDPKDGVGYTYLRFKDKKSVQLMAMFESDGMGAKIALGENVWESEVWGESAYAAANYTDRHPAAFGKKLGILIESITNTPLNEVSAYTASGVNLGLSSIASGTGIVVVGNTGSGVLENLSGTWVLAKVLSPASMVVASGSGGSVPSGPRGALATDSAISCKALQTNGVSTDGLYWIKPTADTAFQAYCDMTMDGGGWTLVVRATSGNALHQNTAVVSTLTSPTQTASAKLSDAMINGFGDKTIYRLSNDTKSRNVYYDTSGPFTAVGTSTSRVKAAYSDATFLWSYPGWAYHVWFNNYGANGINDWLGGNVAGIYSGYGNRLGMIIGAEGEVGWYGPGINGSVWLK